MGKSAPHGRAILVGPSIDLPRAKQLAWLRESLKRTRIGAGDFLVGVDGGIHFLGKHRPALVIGDWDSAGLPFARQFVQRGAKLLALPRRKNQSDLAAALEQIAKQSVRELLLFGFTGGRPDHHLSNLLELADFAETHGSKASYQKIAAFGPEAEYHFLSHSQPELRLTLHKGQLISVFALGEGAKGVSMNGFEYNLKNEALKPGSRGLSNVARAREVRIRVRRGLLLVVIPVIPAVPGAR